MAGRLWKVERSKLPAWMRNNNENVAMKRETKNADIRIQYFY
jgi:hypothetical protein